MGGKNQKVSSFKIVFKGIEVMFCRTPPQKNETPLDIHVYKSVHMSIELWYIFLFIHLFEWTKFK